MGPLANTKPFCWWCSRKLAEDKKNGGHYHVLVTDQLGHQHKVHKVCSKDAEASVKKLTADIPPVVSKGDVKG